MQWLTLVHTEDAECSFFNPAGISFIPNKLSVAVGGFGAITEVEYQSLETLQSYKTETLWEHHYMQQLHIKLQIMFL